MVSKVKWDIIQCAGAIDGSHIPVSAPIGNHTDYYNRKDWYSIVIQAVVDHNYIFHDIYIGWPGSVHDARVFVHSSLYKKVTVGSILNGACSDSITGYLSFSDWRLCTSPVTMANEAFSTKRNTVRSREEVQLPLIEGSNSRGKCIRSTEGSLI